MPVLPLLPSACAYPSFLVLQVGIGKDHTLFALVEGYVQFSRVARDPIPPQRGRKWHKRSWRRFVHVSEIPKEYTFVLKQIIYPSSMGGGVQLA